MTVSPRMTRSSGWREAGFVGACLVLIILVAGCGGDAPAAGSADSAGEPPPVEDTGLPEVSSLDPELGLGEKWTGDLDGMVERDYIRALVVYNKTGYFIDRGAQRGLTYEVLREFETFLNERLGRRTLRVEVVILPVERDELIPALVDGLGDIAAANLTATPARREQVDFSNPLFRDVNEVLVTGPGAPSLSGLDDLSGKTIHVRRSSSYWESLETLNASFAARGLDPVEMKPVVEYLEDEDLLEMVNGGLLPMVVVDSHKAEFWAQVFDQIAVREDLAVRTGGEIAWAFRQGSPQLAELVNEFVRGHKKGTLFGNVVLKRYLEKTTWVDNPGENQRDQRFQETIALFRTYAEKYNFDPLLLAAVAYQESKIDQSKRSHAGAVGVMQIKPSTAADPNVGIPDVSSLENNIHAGTKYLAFLRDRYFSDSEITPFNRDFLTLAAYNAGPARVRKLRAEAAEQGLDPNVWFRNVEVVAARRVGRETVRYVSNITKYWLAYRMVSDQRERVENK